MADAKHPYTSGANGLVAAVSQLRKSFPAKVTAETLKKLGIAPNNETYIINILRFLDVIDAEGNKVQEAATVFVQHEEAAFQSGFAGMVRSAYDSLFELYGNETWTTPIDKLIAFFRSSDHTSDIVGRRQATTFQTLATLSGQLDGQLPKATTKTKKADAAPSKKPAKPANQSGGTSTSKTDVNATASTKDKGTSAGGGDMALTVRIEINLPAGGDKETYDNIFKSIREHLLNGKSAQ